MFTTPVREENLGYAASIYIPPGPRLGDIIFIKVDLPAPFGPITPTIAPNR